MTTHPKKRQRAARKQPNQSSGRKSRTPFRRVLVATNALTLIAFLVLLWLRYRNASLSLTKEQWETLGIVGELGKNIIEVTAIVVGGVFAYYKFFRGRIFNTRLETTVTGRISFRNQQTIVIATGRIKNVGTSNINLDKEGHALRVTTYTASDRKGIATPIADESATYGIFPRDETIESGEVLENQRLIPIHNDDYVAIGLELYVFSTANRTWYTSTLVERPEEKP